MSASPNSAVASAKRPLEDPSSPAGPNDMPDAKRQALDKTFAEEAAPAQEGKDPATNGDKGVSQTNDEPKTVAAEPVELEEASIAKKEETQPIPSTTAAIDQLSAVPASMPTQDESQWVHIRSVISSAEAATVIGKGGENVTQIRRLSGAKCTVSDYSKGAVERILTVSGAQDAVAKVRPHSTYPYTILTLAGFRIDHSNLEQRIPRCSINSSVENLSVTAVDTSCSYRLHHWQVWRTNSRNPGGVRCSAECLRCYSATIYRAISSRVRCG